MFKGMPKIFWIGMSIMYGYFFLFAILEMTIPGFPLMKFLGIPFCYTYNLIVGCLLINVLISWLFFRSEEQREKRLSEQ